MPALRTNSCCCLVLGALLFFVNRGFAQEDLDPATAGDLKLFPHIYQELPGIVSPLTLDDGTEVIVCRAPAHGYWIIPVTQEKGGIYSCQYGFKGKGDQLRIDVPDFPPLGETGLHAEKQLDGKEMITGRTTELINFMARPGRLSHSGFIAADEDIISVLKGDNRLVRQLGMVHSRLAKPLFHAWNTVIGGFAGEMQQNPLEFYYQGKKLFIEVTGGRGYQESIFHDEIEGQYNIHIWREVSEEETEYLEAAYPGLPEEGMDAMLDKLSHLHISEMLPFYIMRYGFYEGHTDFRADPLAIAFIFGLKDIREIDQGAEGDMTSVLSRHFTSPER